MFVAAGRVAQVVFDLGEASAGVERVYSGIVGGPWVAAGGGDDVFG